METVKKVTQWPYRCKLCDMAVFLLQKQKEKVKKWHNGLTAVSSAAWLCSFCIKIGKGENVTQWPYRCKLCGMAVGLVPPMAGGDASTQTYRAACKHAAQSSVWTIHFLWYSQSFGRRACEHSDVQGSLQACSTKQCVDKELLGSIWWQEGMRALRRTGQPASTQQKYACGVRTGNC